MKDIKRVGVVFVCAVLGLGCMADGRGYDKCVDADCDPAAEAVVDNPMNGITDQPTRPDPIPQINTTYEMAVGQVADYEAPVVEPEPETEDPENTGTPNGPDAPVGDELILQTDLTNEEAEEIETLRGAIFDGLDIGRVLYVDTLELVLEGYNIEVAEVPEDAGEEPEEVSCPFVAAYVNGFVPDPLTCEYLADVAKVEAYSKLVGTLNSATPMDIHPLSLEPEAKFWREQGLISGIEEQRVVRRGEMTIGGLCNKQPTPVENSVIHGLKKGKELFIVQFNQWLAAHGYTADYPVMSSKITVCNANVAMLEPAHKAAQDAIPGFTENNSLCPGYAPPTTIDQLQFAQAEIEYEKAIEIGVNDEFAKAAVSVFNVVPCNVSDPVVIDLDRDGFELLAVHEGVNFDLYGAGRVQAVAWVSSDDGLLALDRNGNGKVDDGTELFGNIEREFADGFAHLRTLDSNGDGTLNADDNQFSELLVWRDGNSDGVSTADELMSLASVGVTAIPLTPATVSMTAAGNSIPLVVQASTIDGPMQIGDALLRTAPWPRRITQ